MGGQGEKTSTRRAEWERKKSTEAANPGRMSVKKEIVKKEKGGQEQVCQGGNDPQTGSITCRAGRRREVRSK